MSQLILKTLSLKNFATFNDQTILFNDGLNAIIGETGSGKSLILDALELILGARADKKLIRKDCDFSIVEATFEARSPHVKNFFDEIGHPCEDDILIKRIVYKTETSKAFVNYQQANVNLLGKISKHFIDLVGQFENQKLFNEHYQLQLLDEFSKQNNHFSNFTISYKKLTESKVLFESLNQKAQDTQRRLDYLIFQIEELERLSPDTKEEIELEAKKKLYLDFEHNQKTQKELEFLFEGNENFPGVNVSLSRINKILSTVTSLDPEMTSQFIDAKDVIQELSFKISQVFDFEFSEEDLKEVIERLDLYKKLQRKYNTSTEGLVSILREYTQERETLINIEHSLEEANKKYLANKDHATQLARVIHNIRLNSSKLLADHLTKAVQKLRMNGASFKIIIEEKELTQTGITKIALLAQTNPGEGFYKVKEIASGGELSRILLALRQVLSTSDCVSIFLFDEIDSGIGGETALLIGKALKDVSKGSQVISITHLAQIASFADKLICVSKEVIINESNSQRTISLVNEVSGDKIRTEIDKMTPLFN